jgi:hypothetical protein
MKLEQIHDLGTGDPKNLHGSDMVHYLVGRPHFCEDHSR